MNEEGHFVKWYINYTPIIRLLEKEYVERFFDTGELRLSTYKQFNSHGDPERKDAEGKNILYGKGEKHTVFAVTGHGTDAYVLCGTNKDSVKDLKAKLPMYNAGIVILNPTLFGTEIAKRVPECRWGTEGPCKYDLRSIESKLDEATVERLLKNGDMTDLEILIRQMSTNDVYFRKSSKFQHQMEYRWLWFSKGPILESITLKVPEARKHCKPIFNL